MSFDKVTTAWWDSHNRGKQVSLASKSGCRLMSGILTVDARSTTNHFAHLTLPFAQWQE